MKERPKIIKEHGQESEIGKLIDCRELGAKPRQCEYTQGGEGELPVAAEYFEIVTAAPHHLGRRGGGGIVSGDDRRGEGQPDSEQKIKTQLIPIKDHLGHLSRGVQVVDGNGHRFQRKLRHKVSKPDSDQRADGPDHPRFQ